MLAACLLAFSSLLTLPDSLPPTDSVRPKPPALKPAFNLDFRDSFLERQHINVWGVNAGFTYGRKRHQLTIGYYWLNYATYLRLIDWRRSAAQRINLNYYTRTDMWFISSMYWWNMVNNKRWLVSLPVELGGGVAYAIPLNLSQNVPVDRSRRDFFVPLQVGAYGQWRATRWVGLSAQIGYRVSIFQTAIDQNFNGSYYSIGVSLYPAFLTDVWRWIRKKDRISPLHPPVPRKP
ncbi:hypothetical protein [Spirosoma foliorum]|uniref:Uncharacterized protein n=1 Tax=Spirosoma foliorum TaxID=2710596 RepID=A0A7G5H640_9BACT|nr:hypothetical protein [Spirosoma foliorum]QMW06582.1 hypothetical protein H3H32_17630 [Spirosoma foliorum]